MQHFFLKVSYISKPDDTFMFKPNNLQCWQNGGLIYNVSSPRRISTLLIECIQLARSLQLIIPCVHDLLE